jgi:hypothetical protein
MSVGQPRSRGGRTATAFAITSRALSARLLRVTSIVEAPAPGVLSLASNSVGLSVRYRYLAPGVATGHPSRFADLSKHHNVVDDCLQQEVRDACDCIAEVCFDRLRPEISCPTTQNIQKITPPWTLLTVTVNSSQSRGQKETKKIEHLRCLRTLPRGYDIVRCLKI